MACISHVYVYVCVGVCLCIRICICRCTHTCTCIHVSNCKCIRTCIRTTRRDDTARKNTNRAWKRFAKSRWSTGRAAVAICKRAASWCKGRHQASRSIRGTTRKSIREDHVLPPMMPWNVSHPQSATMFTPLSPNWAMKPPRIVLLRRPVGPDLVLIHPRPIASVIPQPVLEVQAEHARRFRRRLRQHTHVKLDHRVDCRLLHATPLSSVAPKRKVQREHNHIVRLPLDADPARSSCQGLRARENLHHCAAQLLSEYGSAPRHSC